MCAVWISEQTAIISLYNINWLVFITETECVYCAVRTGLLNKVHISWTVQILKQNLAASFHARCQIPYNPLQTSPKRQCIYSTPHGITPHKMAIFTVTAMTVTICHSSYTVDKTLCNKPNYQHPPPRPPLSVAISDATATEPLQFFSQLAMFK
jgi:hypothetical protein